MLRQLSYKKDSANWYYDPTSWKSPHCRSEGGDKVEAVLTHADGSNAVRATVKDNTNGAYSLAFRLELQGEWRLTPHVNGADIAAAAVKVPFHRRNCTSAMPGR